MSNLLCVGTAGMSVWFSRDNGETWIRPYIESGLYLEARVWALSAHPQRPGEVLAGTDSGLYRWNEGDAEMDAPALGARRLRHLVDGPGAGRSRHDRGRHPARQHLHLDRRRQELRPDQGLASPTPASSSASRA